MKSSGSVKGGKTMSNIPGPDPRLAQVQLLNVREVAELFGFHVRTVWRMAAAGELPRPIRVGSKAQRWRLRDLETFIEGGKP
jgi:predicted DNA-binding transcriptional regulator AlpA